MINTKFGQSVVCLFSGTQRERERERGRGREREWSNGGILAACLTVSRVERRHNGVAR